MEVCGDSAIQCGEVKAFFRWTHLKNEFLHHFDRGKRSQKTITGDIRKE
jgi:hypothetical protein